MGIFTVGTLGKLALELALGFGLKLFIENGRISWSDFVNDFLFWVPGVDAVDGDGLTRQVMASSTALELEVDATPTRMAAK